MISIMSSHSRIRGMVILCNKITRNSRDIEYLKERIKWFELR